MCLADYIHYYIMLYSDFLPQYFRLCHIGMSFIDLGVVVVRVERTKGSFVKKP